MRDRAAEQLQAAADHLQDVVEVVRHAAGQLADRLQPLRMLKRFACIFEQGALGDVTRDFRKADQLVLGIADRVDHHAGAEAAAVLAHAPAFGFEAAVLAHLVQDLVG